MKKIKSFRKVFLLMIAMTIFNNIASASFSDFKTKEVELGKSESYYNRWCRDVGSILDIAIYSAYSTETYEEEKEVLLNAVIDSIKKVPAKDNFYFLETLNAIAMNVNHYTEAKSQVQYLRSYVRYALSDLAYLDSTFVDYGNCFFCGNNHSVYVQKIIGRGLEEGLAQLKDESEIVVLNQTATQARFYLKNSAYTRSYKCAMTNIENALEVSNVISKRAFLKRARNQIKTTNCYL